MNNNIDFKIDFVIPWVDGSDKSWTCKKNSYIKKNNDGTSEERFRDFGTLKYLLRSIEKYADWVHKIFLITDHQVPNWLHLNEKIVVIDHNEYIPVEVLPTFNSNVIELNVWRIEELSEHFVLLNDDFLFIKNTQKKDFFSPDGKPKDIAAQSILMPRDDFTHIAVNNLSLINNSFDKHIWLLNNWKTAFNFRNGIILNILSLLVSPLPYFTRFYDPHIAVSYKKKNFIKIWNMFPEQLKLTNQNKFREINEVSHWLVRYFQIVSGQISPRSHNFSKYYDISQVENIKRELRNPKHYMIVLNDANLNSTSYEQGLKTVQLLDIFLNKRSQFEKRR